jgi:hypothetical protein
VQSIERLELMMRQQLQPARPDISFSALGLRALEVLQQLGKVEEFTGDEAAGAAVLDAAEQAQLAGCTSETEVVERLTPVLWGLRAGSGGSEDACRYVLVNGENFSWLDDPVTPLPSNLWLKPDLFRAPHICVEVREGTRKQGSGDSYIFGRLADRCLQLDGCVREVYEAKWKDLTLHDFGELVNYHQLIRGVCRGMLFNGSRFWLFASLHGHAVHLVKGAWSAPGSASRIRRFFDEDQPQPPPPPLVPLLRHLLSTLRLRAARKAGTSFLGGGGSGRVFCVERVDTAARATACMALKAVTAAGRHWAHTLALEFRMMQHAAAQGAPVVPVVADSLCLLEGVGGGFLLAGCGAPFNATASRAACAAAFESLAALHACDVLHGDARLTNLLRLDGAAAWVDVSATAVARAEAPQLFAIARQADATALTLSLLRAAGVQAHPLPAAVSAALAAYDDESAERVRALAGAVWAAVSGAAE